MKLRYSKLKRKSLGATGWARLIAADLDYPHCENGPAIYDGTFCWCVGGVSVVRQEKR